ncbi:protein of unknown function (plasmid) [Cupriavidus taiwanensis]|uniref:Uncharacterized protein n=1 Tax=Cupriavidus taiwanensis TaxID=164546 RepID=A0A7Z7NPL9_9BURK|nr:protein of unknown function [Cupriavidus taiwanensis]SOZ41407.1 protein of unknown function [Cupriavidus taiwanensis]SPC23781.1 protein of unknown function [Cupriavidus taiwanensis]SPD54961.1 protein of unknown function [Cupriavidus taiwanensis]
MVIGGRSGSHRRNATDDTPLRGLGQEWWQRSAKSADPLTRRTKTRLVGLIPVALHPADPGNRYEFLSNLIDCMDVQWSGCLPAFP